MWSASLTPSNSNVCSRCDAPMVPGASFCRECGTAVSPTPAAPATPDPSASYDAGHYQPSFFTPDPGVVPGELGSMGSRTGAWAISNLAVGLISYVPVVGWIVSLTTFIWTLTLYKRGQDIGARILGLRVIRDTGELAGFYHMWTRTLASLISLLAVGAGFWTAYSERDRRTWHDKWLGTYVVKSGPEVDELPATSSSAAKTWFWISIAFSGALLVLTAFLAVPGDSG